MKREDISRAITGIDGEYIEEAAAADGRTVKRRRIKRWTAAAAACLCAAVVIAAVPHLRGNEPHVNTTAGDEVNTNGFESPSGDSDGNSGIVPTVQAADLMSGIVPRQVESAKPDERFAAAQMGFAVELFKAVSAESEGENVLVSPLSVQLALAMTANGADGDTLAEMEDVLSGGMSIGELNRYMKGYTDGLYTGQGVTLRTANSIWFRDDGSISVSRDFLQTNADWYGAAARALDFSDPAAVHTVNGWVKEQTDGLIDGIIDKIDPLTAMYLVNTVTFDGEWEQPYEKNDVEEGVFTSLSGDEQSVTMMDSTEENSYLDGGNAVGFIKEYANIANGTYLTAPYYFAALLPNEDVELEDYIAGLTGEGLLETLRGRQDTDVLARVPKFSYEFDMSMADVLSGMGMESAFDPSAADFGNIGEGAASLYLSDVLHKTYISVNEEGTKAGAASAAELSYSGDILREEYKTVTLDRPFVYMIVDASTDLPIFMGAVTDVAE